MKYIALTVFILAMFISPAQAADTYDLADYWMITPGQWVNLADNSGNVVKMITVQDGDLRKLEIRSIASDGTETLERRIDQKLTADSIVFWGEYNFRDGNSIWIPPVYLPLNVSVGQGFPYVTAEQLLIDYYPLYFTVVFENDRYSITTSAGTFENCLKIIMNDIDFNSITTDVYFLAKGIGVVRQVRTVSYADGPTNVIDSSTWDMISYGTE